MCHRLQFLDKFTRTSEDATRRCVKKLVKINFLLHTHKRLGDCETGHCNLRKNMVSWKTGIDLIERFYNPESISQNLRPRIITNSKVIVIVKMVIAASGKKKLVNRKKGVDLIE